LELQFGLILAFVDAGIFRTEQTRCYAKSIHFLAEP
jgi:hypothetical protein